ncbi:MAG: hypothetical protein LIO46_00600 [Clostridiales bacterium]|nr:hypothetical protein [Clostridiales bacterium]
MIALMEAATCACVQAALEEDETTVGTRVEITHSRATGTGKAVTATAVLLEADGRRLLFQVRCKDPAGLVGEGRIERFVVQGGKFMEKAART